MYLYMYTHTHTYHSDFSIHRQCLKDLAAGRFTGSSLVTQQKPPVGRPLREQRRQRLRLSMRQSPVSGCTARAGGHVLRGWVRDRARNFRAAMPGLRTEAGRWLKRLGCTHTHTDRQTDTQTHRHTHRHTDTHTDTQTHRHTDTQTHRHTDTQTHRHTSPTLESRFDKRLVGHLSERLVEYSGNGAVWISKLDDAMVYHDAVMSCYVMAYHDM